MFRKDYNRQLQNNVSINYISSWSLLFSDTWSLPNNIWIYSIVFKEESCSNLFFVFSFIVFSSTQMWAFFGLCHKMKSFSREKSSAVLAAHPVLPSLWLSLGPYAFIPCHHLLSISEILNNGMEMYLCGDCSASQPTLVKWGGCHCSDLTIQRRVGQWKLTWQGS